MITLSFWQWISLSLSLVLWGAVIVYYTLLPHLLKYKSLKVELERLRIERDRYLLKYKSLKVELERLRIERDRWIYFATEHGYQFFFCPDCSHPIIRGGFDEGGVCFCGSCDAVFHVELAGRMKSGETEYKLTYLGDVTELDVNIIKNAFISAKK